MSFKYCLILLVQEHEHFIQRHYFWNNLVYECMETNYRGVGSCLWWKLNNCICLFCNACLLAKCWECSIHTCISHCWATSSVICCSSVVLFSLGTSWSLCMFFLASLLGLVLYIQGHNETQKRCSVSTIGTQYKHSMCRAYKSVMVNSWST